MRTRLAGAALVVAVVAHLGLSAQTPAPGTATAVLERYIAAVGGRDALGKLTSATGRGTIEIADFGISGTIQITQKSPALYASIVELAGIGTTREGFDGTTAWEDNPQAGLRERAGPELAEARVAAVFPRELRLATIYPSIVLKPREKVATRDADVLEATSPNGTPVRMYFDTETGLLLRQVTTRTTPQGPTEVDAYFTDYRVVDGVKRAFNIRQLTATFTAVIQFAEVKHNAPVDEAGFRKPVR